MTDGIDFQVLDGKQAAARADELRAVHTDVYGQEPAWAGRLRVQARQRGFVLAAAWHGDYLVGYACGMPLRASTDWWRLLTTPLPPQVTSEHDGRTFAVLDVLVRASWRRQGIAGTLHDFVLSSRPEERATAAVPPGAGPAQHAFRRWGWRRVARRGDPRADVLLLDLPEYSRARG
jgi:GNAT superfamily N-acetyltransferase